MNSVLVLKTQLLGGYEKVLGLLARGYLPLFAKVEPALPTNVAFEAKKRQLQESHALASTEAAYTPHRALEAR